MKEQANSAKKKNRQPKRKNYNNLSTTNIYKETEITTLPLTCWQINLRGRHKRIISRWGQQTLQVMKQQIHHTVKLSQFLHNTLCTIWMDTLSMRDSLARTFRTRDVITWEESTHQKVEEHLKTRVLDQYGNPRGGWIRFK